MSSGVVEGTGGDEQGEEVLVILLSIFTDSLPSISDLCGVSIGSFSLSVWERCVVRSLVRQAVVCFCVGVCVAVLSEGVKCPVSSSLHLAREAEAGEWKGRAVDRERVPSSHTGLTGRFLGGLKFALPSSHTSSSLTASSSVAPVVGRQGDAAAGGVEGSTPSSMAVRSRVVLQVVSSERLFPKDC